MCKDVIKKLRNRMAYILSMLLLLSCFSGCSGSRVSDDSTGEVEMVETAESQSATDGADLNEAGTETTEAAEDSENREMTIEQITELNGEDVIIHKNEDGVITFIGGTCTDKPVKEDGDAYLVLESMLSLLGGDENTEFEYQNCHTDNWGNKYYSFSQFYKNRSLADGLIKIIVNKDDEMTGIVSDIVTDYPADYDGKEIDASELAEIVYSCGGYDRDELTIYEDLTEVGLFDYVRDPNLDVNTDEDDPELASICYNWVVYTNNPEGGSEATPNDAFTSDFPFDDSDYTYRAHYITFNGEYLYSIPIKEPGDEASQAGYVPSYIFEYMEADEWTGTLTENDGSEVTVTVPVMKDPESGRYYLGDIERRIAVADAYSFMYEGYVADILSSDTNDDWNDYYLLTYYNIIRIWDYYNDLGWKGTDGEGTPILVLTDLCYADREPYDNAVYGCKTHGWSMFAFADCNSFGGDLDVVAHEYTHGFDDGSITYVAYKNEMGAIEESYADIMGNLCQHTFNPEEDSEWLLGETSGALRSMSNPLAYYLPEQVWDLFYIDDVAVPTNGNDRGGVHYNSSILNHIAYRICEEAGMSVEDAVDLWLSFGLARVNYTDFSQLGDILLWSADNNGLDQYADEIEQYIEDAGLGERDVPEQAGDNQAIISLELPDDEIYKDGYWSLVFLDYDPDSANDVTGSDKVPVSYYGFPGEDNRTINMIVPSGDNKNIVLQHFRMEASEMVDMILLIYTESGEWKEIKEEQDMDYISIEEGKVVINTDGLDEMVKELMEGFSTDPAEDD